MKKTALLLALCALTLMILLPAFTSVNNLTGGSTVIDRLQQADGWPLPPPIPPNATSATVNTLVADGWPLPPPIPPNATSATVNALVADGWPLPPPIPPNANAPANPYSV